MDRDAYAAAEAAAILDEMGGPLACVSFRLERVVPEVRADLVVAVAGAVVPVTTSLGGPATVLFLHDPAVRQEWQAYFERRLREAWDSGHRAGQAT